MSVHVVAHFYALAGRGPEVESLLRPLVTPTTAEDGCVFYRYFRDNDDADHFVFVEEWRDDQSLDVHLRGPRVTTMRAAAEPLLAEPIQGFRMTMV